MNSSIQKRDSQNNENLQQRFVKFKSAREKCRELQRASRRLCDKMNSESGEAWVKCLNAKKIYTLCSASFLCPQKLAGFARAHRVDSTVENEQEIQKLDELQACCREFAVKLKQDYNAYKKSSE